MSAWTRILKQVGLLSATFRLGALNNRGWSCFLRYLARGRIDDLHKAIAFYQRAIAEAPAGWPDLQVYLSNLAVGLDAVYENTNSLADLERALKVWEHAIERTPPGTLELPDRWNKLGRALMRHYDRTGAETQIDLERAAQAWEKAVRLAPPNSPTLSGYLSNLAVALDALYKKTNLPADLERAIRTSERAVERTPKETPELPERLDRLARALMLRYHQTETSVDLENATQTWEKAVALAAADSTALPGYLSLLGLARSALYARNSVISNLERAIQVWEQVVALLPAGSSDLPSSLNRLGKGLHDRYKRTGEVTDLDRAIQGWEQAVAQTTSESPNFLGRLNSLGIGLNDRYDRSGTLADLEHAIGIWEQIVVKTPAGSLDLATHLNNLGSGLRARYHRTGALADLERAIGAWEQAVAQTPTPELAGHLLNLGNGLVDRYERTRALGDLEQAVHAFEQAVTKTPPDSPDLPARLNGLGSGLMHRYMVAESPADLERAIDAWEQVVTRTPAGSVDLPAYLNSLGAGLGVRYARTEDLADLEHSIESYEQAVARAPASSPVLPGIRNNLAASLRVRYERTRMPADLERATSVYEMASKEGLKMAVEAGLHSARDWGNWASDRGAWQEAVRAYGYAAQASEWLFRIQMVRRNKEVWLRETQGLPARSAYALAKTSDLRGAVVALERGRAQLLSETLERDRVDLEALRLTDAHLYTRYQQTVERVVHLANAELREAMFPPDFDLTFEAQAARAGLDAAVEAIRHLPGHEAFLSLPVFADVKAALTPAPSPRAFIYVAATPVGTLAIVVTVEAVEDIWLTFTEADLDTLLAEREGQAATGGYLPSQLIPAWMEGALTDALPLLGERIMGPVAARIRPRGLKQVILIPAGRLALLPLHAARYQVDKTATYFLDEFAVAYSPNARTLATAQREMSRRNSQLQLVGVGNPMPHPKPLLAAQAELEEVAATLFPENASPPLYGEAATRAALLRVIPEGVYLHFACHGVFNSEDPLASRLELSGQEPLTLRDLLDGAAQPVRARLAVLSACQSALSDFRELPDEFIGLPAGFLQAGVPGVVGTLWPVDDLSTALLMVKFYELHLRGSRSGPLVPAEALRRAQQWLRDVTNGELAEYFAAHCRLDELRRRTVAHMSDATVLAGLVGFAVGDPHVRPFSQRPYFWAPFVFFGV